MKITQWDVSKPHWRHENGWRTNNSKTGWQSQPGLLPWPSHLSHSPRRGMRPVPRKPVDSPTRRSKHHPVKKSFYWENSEEGKKQPPWQQQNASAHPPKQPPLKQWADRDCSFIPQRCRLFRCDPCREKWWALGFLILDSMISPNRNLRDSVAGKPELRAGNDLKDQPDHTRKHFLS